MATVLSGCGFGLQKSGIEIITYPLAKVYINGKEAGMTPYKNNTLKPGELKVGLMANGMEWSKVVHLESGANTVINRSFEEGGESGGYILYFEKTGNLKKSGIMITTRPDRSTILIEDEIKGFTPIRLEDVGEGDKKLTISFPGYKSINSYIRMVSGYQLIVEADLSKEKIVVAPTTVLPSPTVASQGPLIIIKETETGWLRVRSTPATEGVEVAKVKPGEKYPLIDQDRDWFKIDLGSGKSGWILAKYADIS